MAAPHTGARLFRAVGFSMSACDARRYGIVSAQTKVRWISTRELEEMLPLHKTGDSFRKIIVTGDYQDLWKDESGVVHVGVIPFLLDKKLLER